MTIYKVQESDTDTPVITYVSTDHLGSTNVVTDSTGAQAELLDYFPYGNQRISTGSSQRQYIGQYFDNDTSLSYLNARYYNGNKGRFISQDPVFWEVGQTDDGRGILVNPQLQNSYSYAGGNPITNSDPEGELAVKFDFATNIGFGGATGNTWSVGFASDGTYGVSTGFHAGGFAGGDASINVSIGYSNAKTWDDTGGEGSYVTGGGKIGVGVGADVNFSPDGKYDGIDVGVGIGPSTPVYMGGGLNNNTIVISRSVKQDVQSITQGVSNTINLVIGSIGQGVNEVINKLTE